MTADRSLQHPHGTPYSELPRVIKDAIVPSPPPPSELGDFEKPLWSRLIPRLICSGRFEPEDTPAATTFVRSAGYYLRLTRRLKELQAEHVGKQRLDTADAEREASRWRRTARESAADLDLLPVGRAGLAHVDTAGEDIELKRILGLEVYLSTRSQSSQSQKSRVTSGMKDVSLTE